MNPIVVRHSKIYKEKEIKLSNYEKLNVASTLRQFEKTIQGTYSINFQVQTIDVTARVHYDKFNITFHYSLKLNMIVIMDIDKTFRPVKAKR